MGPWKMEMGVRLFSSMVLNRTTDQSAASRAAVWVSCAATVKISMRNGPFFVGLLSTLPDMFSAVVCKVACLIVGVRLVYESACFGGCCICLGLDFP